MRDGVKSALAKAIDQSNGWRWIYRTKTAEARQQPEPPYPTRDWSLAHKDVKAVRLAAVKAQRSLNQALREFGRVRAAQPKR